MDGRMKSTPLTAAIYEYVVSLFASRERDLLDEMSARAERAGLPPIMISEDQARFLTVLLAFARPKRILDVGTLFGYSAAILALASPASRVVSLEIDARHAKVAEQNLRASGLGGRVAIRLGPALESMKAMRGGTFDLVLVDADKENYPHYLDEASRLLRKGGLLLIDNAFAWGEVADKDASPRHGPDVPAIRRTNDALASRKDFVATILPLGDGLALAVKRGG